MTYEETIEFLYEKLPVFHRVGGEALKPGLKNIEALCEALGNPHRKFKSIHIAGTNGKGSSSHILSAILQTAGYRVGLHTSPHLKNFTERFKINGQEANENVIVDFVHAHTSLIETIQPSFFEISVALAFDYFAKQNLDIAIIEVGLGGRLDSTNIITPLVSLITNISFDHTQFLGNTLEKIASEKAGIIKLNVPVVISEFQEETAPVFYEKAKSENSKTYLSYNKYKIYLLSILNGLRKIEIYRNNKLWLETELDLLGDYQQYNLAGVLQTVEVLQNLGYDIKPEHIKTALPQVAKLTNFKGRWQKLSDAPMTIADVGHNFSGLNLALTQFRSYTFRKLHVVLGFVKDKSIDDILPLFPKDANYYFCQPQNFRALPAETLKNKAADFGLIGNFFETVEEALADARRNADDQDFIYIGGSTFVVSELAEI